MIRVDFKYQNGSDTIYGNAIYQVQQDVIVMNGRKTICTIPVKNIICIFEI
jgi:hypothetical protein